MPNDPVSTATGSLDVANPADVAPSWTPKFPIVGIGASAGGLEALESLVRRLAVDGMAYVIMQHLAPTHESLLTEILARNTPMRVATIHDRLELEVNVIYVAPPNADVTFERGQFRLLKPSDLIPKHSIDLLFRSLAAEMGTAAIGVVLSGAGIDGTRGLREIKDAGGITFAQEPSSAGQASMPQSAVDAGVADFCLTPAEIGDELMRLGTHPFVARRRSAAFFPPEALASIFKRLKTAYGVDFSAYKQSTLERRIARRMALQKLESIEDYLKFLDSSSGELATLYGDVLIGVTEFFRDIEPFQYLKDTIFPRLFEKRGPEQPIRIWIAGCASGEEAYSIAICLLEYLGDRVANYRIQIFATDIDDDALATARVGMYPASISLDVSTERLQRFFLRTENGFQVARQIRDLIVFARHNLGKDPPFSRLDLVTCRNVLIYMQVALQRRVLRVLHYALNPDAFLLLGTSESVGDAADLFSLVDRQVKVYQKKNAPSAVVFDFGSGMEREVMRFPIVRGADHRTAVTIQQLADRKVLEKYAPPGVLLNEQNEVIQFRGATGPFLAPTPGTATFNVFKLARPELLPELRSTVQHANDDGLPRSSAEIPAWDPAIGPIMIDVVPVHDTSSERKCLLVSFRTSSAKAEPGPSLTTPPSPDVRVQNLERELVTTKDYLQTTVHELEGSNEDLQSANEELQSSNEELQSANEELETSKEELQSTNEELATVNDELQNRMSQLAISNDDLQNVLSHVTSAIMLVGMDLRLRRFTASAEAILNLMSSDIGRPISYIDTMLKPAQVEQSVSETIRTMSVHEQRVPDRGGHLVLDADEPVSHSRSFDPRRDDRADPSGSRKEGPHTRRLRARGPHPVDAQLSTRGARHAAARRLREQALLRDVPLRDRAPRAPARSGVAGAVRPRDVLAGAAADQRDRGTVRGPSRAPSIRPRRYRRDVLRRASHRLRR